MQDTGLCLFFLNLQEIQTSNTQEEKSPQLISGFLSAIMTFAEEIHSSGPAGEIERTLHKFQLEKYVYYILEGQEFFFCINTDKISEKLEEKDFQFILNQIADHFLNLVENDQIDLNGIDVTTNTQLEDFIRETISTEIRKKLFRS